MKGEELLTMGAAQRALGLKWESRGRRLLRHVLAKETETGQRIAQRVTTRGSGRKRHLRVSLSSLRRHCPELFPSAVDELQRGFRTYLSEIDERVATITDERIAATVEPRLDELWERDEKIARSVKDLAVRVKSLAGVLK